MWRLLGVMTLAACGAVPQVSADTVGIDQPFGLQIGRQVRWADAGLTLHFEKVLVDSRCPRGERCVVAGVARIRIRVDGAGLAGKYLDLQLPDHPSALLPAQAATLTLLQLDPYPISGRTAVPEEVLATMVIKKAAATDR